MSEPIGVSRPSAEEMTAARTYFSMRIPGEEDREIALLIYDYARRGLEGEVDEAVIRKLRTTIINDPNRAATLDRWQQIYDPLQSIADPAEHEVALHLRNLMEVTPQTFEQQSSFILGMTPEDRQAELQARVNRFLDLPEGEQRLAAQLLLDQILQGHNNPTDEHRRQGTALILGGTHEQRVEMLEGLQRKQDPFITIENENHRAMAMRLRAAMGTDWQTFADNSEAILAMTPDERRIELDRHDRAVTDSPFFAVLDHPAHTVPHDERVTVAAIMSRVMKLSPADQAALLEQLGGEERIDRPGSHTARLAQRGGRAGGAPPRP